MLDKELFDRLTAIERLKCDTRLFSWPTHYRDGYEDAYDQYVRISGSWPSSWRWGKFDIDMQRCQDNDAKICLHVTHFHQPGDDLDDCLRDYKNRWGKVAKELDMSMVEVVYIDLESSDLKYKPHDGTDDTTGYNARITDFNRAIYDIARTLVGDDIDVRRYNHGSTRYWPHADYGEYHIYGDTSWSDPVDGGWGVSMYTPTAGGLDLRNLAATIEEGQRHGIQSGSVWVTAGCTRISDQCPGIPVPYPHVADTVYAVPYDPAVSHKLGSLFGGHWYWRQKVHGDDYRNGTYPALDKVHSVVLWPGVFHEAMDTTAVHLIAFLEGLSCKKYDPRLAGIQAEAVTQ